MTRKPLFKRIIFWALYYLIAAIFVAWGALTNLQNVVFTTDSWFPAAYAACNLLLALFWQSKLNTKLWMMRERQLAYMYHKIVDLKQCFELEHKYTKEAFKTLHIITLAFTPAFFFFVPFFGETAKHFCGFLLLAPSFIWAPFYIWEMFHDTKKHNEQVKKEREKQERREELGKWK